MNDFTMTFVVDQSPAETFAAVNDWATRPENRGKAALFWNTYNSVDLSAILADLDWRRLPRSLWPFFDDCLEGQRA